MIPYNLPPTFIKQSYIAEVRQYVLPMDRENPEHEPVQVPYHFYEVSITPVVGTASLPSVSFLPIYTIGTTQYSNFSLLPHIG